MYLFASNAALTCCEKRPEPREMGTWIKEHISPIAHTQGRKKTTKKYFPLLRGVGGGVGKFVGSFPFPSTQGGVIH